MPTSFHFWAVASVLFVCAAPDALARTVYLNGIDISSARNQTLKDINLRIDENGNVFIEAPHYEVNEQETFAPLSSWLHKLPRPQHTDRSQLPDSLKNVGMAKKVSDLKETPDKNLTPPLDRPADEAQKVENIPTKLQDKPREGDTNDTNDTDK